MKITKDKIWHFVNTNFGLWFLATVFWGGISAGITKLNSNLRVKEKEVRNTEKISSEIEFRTAQFIHRVENSTKRLPDTSETSKRIRLFGSFRDFKNSPENISNKTFYSLYPDFTNRNLISLLSELYDITEDPKLKKLIVYLTSLELCTNEPGCNQTLNSFCENFNDKFLSYEKWKNNRFYNGTPFSHCRD